MSNTPIRVSPMHNREKLYSEKFYRGQKFLYFAANLVILPIYVTLLIMFAAVLSSLVDFPYLLVAGFVWFFGGIPAVTLIFRPNHWRIGFYGLRSSTTITALVMFFVYQFGRDNTALKETYLQMLFGAFLVCFFLCFVVFFDRVRHRLLAIGMMGPLLSVVVLLLVSNSESSLYSPLQQWLFVVVATLVSILCVISLVITGKNLSISKISIDSISNWFRNSLIKSLYILISIGLFTVSLILLNDTQPQDTQINYYYALQFASALIITFAVNGFDKLFSRIRGDMRFGTATLRHDLLVDRASEFTTVTSAFNRFFRAVPRVFDLSNRTPITLLLLLIGGLGVPILYILVNFFALSAIDQIDFAHLMLLGSSFVIILVAIYYIFWIFRNRSKFIVSGFDVQANVNNSNPTPHDEELRAIGKLTTHVLVEELQKISILLRSRQVENLNLDADSTNAFFVTSGNNQEFVTQMQQLVTVDTPATGTFNLGRFLLIIWRLLAKIRVDGRIQRRADESIEIWVQVNYGNSVSAAVSQVIMPENSINDIDEVLVRPIARELALHLFLELGQVSHLGSTTQSLDHFLRGLEASARKDWWQAISFYRKALQIEEATQSRFGVAHFHLGVALLYQGDYRKGLDHLRTAEIDGPIIPETYYMIALAFSIVYWSSLDRNVLR